MKGGIVALHNILQGETQFHIGISNWLLIIWFTAAIS